MTDKFPLIYRQMAKVLEMIGPIGKNHTNSQQGFKYRRIDEFYNHIHVAFAKCGIFCAPQIVGRERLEAGQTKNGSKIYRIINHYRFRFYAEDGSYVESEADGEANDSGDKCTSKASSMAIKYALMQTFLVATADIVDGDDETIENVSNSAGAVPAAFF